MSDQPSVTPSEIASRVLELSEKATEGPWHVNPDGFESKWKYPTVYATDDELRYITDCRDFLNFDVATPNLANAELIAEYRTAAPELARACQQLEQENATLREQLAEYEAEEAAHIASDPAEVLLRESQQRELRWMQDNLTLRELAEGLAKQLREIHAFAWGECPSLLNEDSGGNARLDMAIEEALEKFDSYRAACPGEGLVPMSDYIKLLDLADDLAMQFWRAGSEQKRERIADRYMEIENSAPLEAREFIERKHHKAQPRSASNSPTASRESQG
jgi:hypothetical protein